MESFEVSRSQSDRVCIPRSPDAGTKAILSEQAAEREEDAVERMYRGWRPFGTEKREISSIVSPALFLFLPSPVSAAMRLQAGGVSV
eukprot:3613940-Rhodomonas_salina.1